MSEFTWHGQRIYAEAQQAAIGGVTAVSERAATTAQALNRARRFETGRMAEGWEPQPIEVRGTIVHGGIQNEVVDPRTGFPYPILQDRGGRTITPANVSFDAADQEFPGVVDEIRARFSP